MVEAQQKKEWLIFGKKPIKFLLDTLAFLGILGMSIVVIALSFTNTAKFAERFDIPPLLFAGIVEFLFALLLLSRARQRAAQLNVPNYLEYGFYASFLFVTGVNVWGFSTKDPFFGAILGVFISGAMWLMENLFVWLIVGSHKPHVKTIKEIERETKKAIREEKILQKLEWMKWEAQKPDLYLIKLARKAEEKRQKVVEDGLPEYFKIEKQPHEQVIAEELRRSEPKTIICDPVDEQQPAAIVPMRRIGFNTVETQKTKKPFQKNEVAIQNAIEKAKALKEELGRDPKKVELVRAGVSDHYARIALKEITEK